jgi:hypothetical protein
MARDKLTRSEEHTEQQARTTLNVWDSTADDATGGNSASQDDSEVVSGLLHHDTRNACMHGRI